MEYPYERRRMAPWIWVLIVLAALILVFLIWWAVAAQAPEEEVAIQPEEERPALPPTPPPAEQPVVVEREQPVNIYIQPEQPRPNVVIVPRGQPPPEAKERLRQVDLPGQFRYQGDMWEPSDQAVLEEDVNLKDTGASVGGNIVYADRDAEAPYDRLYLETEPGSGVYLKYEPMS